MNRSRQQLGTGDVRIVASIDLVGLQSSRLASYDFVEAQTHDGRKLRLMTLIDEFTRECLAIRIARRINSVGVLEMMADVMLMRGVPDASHNAHTSDARRSLTSIGSPRTKRAVNSAR